MFASFQACRLRALLVAGIIVVMSYSNQHSAMAAGSPVTTTTTLVMTSSGNSVASGSSVTSGSEITLTAAVSAGSAKVTVGQVNFCDASATYCTDIHLLGTAQLTSSGTAVFRLHPGIGDRSYKAVFVGTRNATPAYSGSISGTVALTVTGLFPTTSTISATYNSAEQNYSLTAAVSGYINMEGQPTPSGTVSFIDTSNNNFSLGTATLGTGTQALSFLNISNPGTVMEPNVVATADFNGDGIPDLAVSNSNSGQTSLTILLGNGDGTFRAAASPTVGLYPDSIVVADFNGDGFPDLALTSVDNNIVTILLGVGDGTFTSAPNLNTVNTPQSVATGDFNGDGIADLAVVNAGSILTFLGNGDGTFKAGSASLPTGMSPITVTVGDFNGDGIADLAVVNSCGNSYPCNNANGTVMIFLGEGDGTFTQVAVTSTVGSNPTGLVVADFNGDGILDLAVSNYAGEDYPNAAVTVLLGNGDGTFKTPANYGAPGMNFRSLLVGDFNGDGISDLAVVGFWHGTLDYLLGKGEGTFAAGVVIPFNLPLGSGYGALADFNGDGLPDLAVPNQDVNGTVVILLTQLTETATATVTKISPLGTGTHQVDASYPGDNSFNGSISASTGVFAQQVKPTVTVTPDSSSINSAQALSVTIAVAAANNDPVATGTVTLTSGGYTSVKTNLSNGSATIIIPAGSLDTGTATLTASYSGDSDYFAAANTASVTVTSLLGSPTVTVTPSSSSISTVQILIVTISVTSAGTNPTPTGAVTLSGGNYISTEKALSSGSAIISIPAGALVTGSATFTATYTPDTNSSTIYTGATGVSSTVTVIAPANPAPVIGGLSPAFISAGGGAFTLTVNGTGFINGSTVYWGATALTTTYASATQLTAAVTAAEIASAGLTAITVQTPAPGGGTSTALQFEVDSAGSGSTAPTLTAVTATITAGSPASYTVTLPSTVESATVRCLNLPTGASCSYASGTVTITTTSATPKGTYKITVIFTETVSGAASSWILIPILLLPLMILRKRLAARGAWMIACLGLVLLAGAGFCVTGCGGGGGGSTPSQPQTHQVVSSGVVTLTIQ